MKTVLKFVKENIVFAVIFLIWSVVLCSALYFSGYSLQKTFLVFPFVSLSVEFSGLVLLLLVDKTVFLHLSKRSNLFGRIIVFVVWFLIQLGLFWLYSSELNASQVICTPVISAVGEFLVPILLLAIFDANAARADLDYW